MRAETVPLHVLRGVGKIDLWEIFGRLKTRVRLCTLESLGLGQRPDLRLFWVWVSQPCLSQPSLTQLGKVSQTGPDQSQQPSLPHRTLA